MSDVLAAAERTPWLAGARIRAYNPTLAMLLVLVPVLTAVGLLIEDMEHLLALAFVLVVVGFAIVLVLVRRSLRGLRLNNGGVALMARGEDLGASNAFRAAARGIFGRDVVGMSLQNLGVLALRSLDLPSAIALQRAAIAVGRGFRFRWQPDLAGDYARAHLAFALAAQGEGLDEADAVLEIGKDTLSPIAIAFRARARAMLAARRNRFEQVVDVLDSERALLRNALPLNDAVLCEALMSYALVRLGDTYRGAARASSSVLADDQARAYVRRIFPEAESVLVS